MLIAVMILSNLIFAGMETPREFYERAERQAPGPKDDSLAFLYRAPISANITTHDVSWQKAGARTKMWNDSYWPTYRGIIAYRYLDKKNIPKTKNWSDHYAYYQSHPSEWMVAVGDEKKLSPAEKYDLLVGNSDWTLTRIMWKRGEDYNNKYGKVTSWFGICHGWAAATHMFQPLPLKPVTVTNIYGKQITFTSSDIRALQSYLWAENSPNSQLVGMRCNYSSTTGSDKPACVDNNPMSWHLAVIHRVGRDGDSMVMDTSAYAEVWNFPVDSYVFQYFNPQSKTKSDSWEKSMLSVVQYPQDPFKKTRTPQTRYIVGVNMKVYHPSAIEPAEKTSTKTLYSTKNFVYDLELDQNFNIVGGEWHSKARPDFLWTYAYGAIAKTKEDGKISGTWSVSQPLPLAWSDLARQASARGDVMRNIVDMLVKQSRESN